MGNRQVGTALRMRSEQPSLAYNKGWVQASLLEPGDRLLSHDLQWIAVEDLLDTGETEAVYNLRIADYHTYLVCGNPIHISSGDIMLRRILSLLPKRISRT